MMLDAFYSENHGKISFTRQQGSDFAKKIAGDFNPIHHVDTKHFCVPGDLLFAVVLHKYGVSQHMAFNFSGMVAGEMPLVLPKPAEQMVIADENGKQYLTVERSGESSQDPTLVEGLTKSYVTFSGQTFPHILVPQMQEKGVMINPDRPLVIYESMVIDLDRLDISAPELAFRDAELDVQGKRGTITLRFELTYDGKVVGKGVKKMVLSGLRDYDQQKIDEMVSNFNGEKAAYQN